MVVSLSVNDSVSGIVLALVLKLALTLALVIVTVAVLMKHSPKGVETNLFIGSVQQSDIWSLVSLFYSHSQFWENRFRHQET